MHFLLKSSHRRVPKVFILIVLLRNLSDSFEQLNYLKKSQNLQEKLFNHLMVKRFVIIFAPGTPNYSDSLGLFLISS